MTLIKFFHPRDSTLNRFADRELSESDRRNVAKHLAVCGRCRRAVGDIRRLTKQAMRLRQPEVPKQLLWKILHASTNGGGAILPDPSEFVPDPPVRVQPRWVMVAVGIAATVVLIIATAPEVVSESSALEITPARPEAGDLIEIEYRATPLLRSPDGVVVRAKFFHANEPAWDESSRLLTLDTLELSKRGTYRGVFRLPEDFAYAELAIESLDGEVIDLGGIEGWTVSAHDGNRPTFEALRQQKFDYFRRNWMDRGFALADSATRLYPNEPSVWSDLLAFAPNFGQAVMDSLVRVQAPIFGRLASQFSDDSPPEWVSEMFWWTFSLQDQEKNQLWRDRALGRAPATHYAVQQFVREVMAEPDSSDVNLVLRTLDALWNIVGPRHTIATPAFYLAAKKHLDSASVVWAARLIELKPWERVNVARRLTSVEGARSEAIDELRTALALVTRSWSRDRPLSHKVSQHARNLASSQRHIASLLGRALLDNGDYRGALSYVDHAVQSGWDVEAFTTAARARLALGDSVAAAQLFSRTYVDSRAVGTASKSIETWGRRLVGERWDGYVTAADSTMRYWVAQESAVLAQMEGDSVLNPGGQTEYLSEAMGSDLTVLAFVWLVGGETHSEIVDLLNVLAKKVKKDGVRVIVLTSQVPNPRFESVINETSTLTWFHDVYASAARYFATRRTPDFFVVDPVTNRQFRSSSFAEIPRQLAVLQQLRSVNSSALIAP